MSSRVDLARASHVAVSRPPLSGRSGVYEIACGLAASERANDSCGHAICASSVYAALAEAELQPDWVAGISIGAINGALIAGNAPERRVEQLKKFWEQITTPPFGFEAWNAPRSEPSDIMRGWMNQTNAAMAMLGGAPGFFTPRLTAPWFIRADGAGATSYYDTAKLRSTLESLVDFDRINSGPVRFTVGAVNVRSGNLVCFDTKTHRIGPEHVMASCSHPRWRAGCWTRRCRYSAAVATCVKTRSNG
ncbi:MAG: hypothetical protein PSV22_13800 [Pseudolabrys sp.]|nr:hypothetical protein [Pseudolabrys sp.]